MLRRFVFVAALAAATALTACAQSPLDSGAANRDTAIPESSTGDDATTKSAPGDGGLVDDPSDMRGSIPPDMTGHPSVSGEGHDLSESGDVGASEDAMAEDVTTFGAPGDAPASVETQTLSLDAGMPGLPPDAGVSIDDVLRAGAVVLWTDTPGTFTLSIPSSDTCFPRSSGVELVGPQQVQVNVMLPDTGCESANAAHTFTLQVPDNTDTTQGLGVTVTGTSDEPVEAALPASTDSH